MEGLKVVCPSCRKVYHETTKHFDPDKSLRGHMVRLLDPWRKWGWCTFGDADNGLPPALAESERTYWSEMDCPGCGSPLAPSQTLMLRNQDDTDYVPTRIRARAAPGRTGTGGVDRDPGRGHPTAARRGIELQGHR
jgi:hypothetical protein